MSAARSWCIGTQCSLRRTMMLRNAATTSPSPARPTAAHRLSPMGLWSAQARRYSGVPTTRSTREGSHSAACQTRHHARLHPHHLRLRLRHTLLVKWRCEDFTCSRQAPAAETRSLVFLTATQPHASYALRIPRPLRMGRLPPALTHRSATWRTRCSSSTRAVPTPDYARF